MMRKDDNMEETKNKKFRFSKLIVVFCIAEMVVIQLWSMAIASRSSVAVTGLLTANHAVFGGELLLLCLKRIFAKNGKEETLSKN